MFKFNFNNSENDQNDIEKTSSTQWHESKEIIPDLSKYDIKSINTKIYECKDEKIKYICSENVIESLKESNDISSSILKAETNHSDLVTGEYEGGLKIWECTDDLIHYINSETITFTDKKVLDLGCGAGMLGIFSLLKGSVVDFQDYNNEVIEYTTIPNVLLNLTNETKFKNCKFYSGDWKSFMNLITYKYDYILTSETIYNPENYSKLLEIFKNLLESNGIIYLAAKTYYFGVGGGVRQFEELLNKSGNFSVETCWKNSEGVQREILKIIKK